MIKYYCDPSFIHRIRALKIETHSEQIRTCSTKYRIFCVFIMNLLNTVLTSEAVLFLETLRRQTNDRQRKKDKKANGFVS